VVRKSWKIFHVRNYHHTLYSSKPYTVTCQIYVCTFMFWQLLEYNCTMEVLLKVEGGMCWQRQCPLDVNSMFIQCRDCCHSLLNFLLHCAFLSRVTLLCTCTQTYIPCYICSSDSVVCSLFFYNRE